MGAKSFGGSLAFRNAALLRRAAEVAARPPDPWQALGVNRSPSRTDPAEISQRSARTAIARPAPRHQEGVPASPINEAGNPMVRSSSCPPGTEADRSRALPVNQYRNFGLGRDAALIHETGPRSGFPSSPVLGANAFFGLRLCHPKQTRTTALTRTSGRSAQSVELRSESRRRSGRAP